MVEDGGQRFIRIPGERSTYDMRTEDGYKELYAELRGYEDKCHLYLSMRVYSYTWDFHKPGISADRITNELDPAQFLTVALLRF